MPDTIAPTDRALIDDAIAAGRIRRIPLGDIGPAHPRKPPARGITGLGCPALAAADVEAPDALQDPVADALPAPREPIPLWGEANRIASGWIRNACISACRRQP